MTKTRRAEMAVRREKRLAKIKKAAKKSALLVSKNN